MRGYVTIDRLGDVVRLTFHKTLGGHFEKDLPMPRGQVIRDEGDYWAARWRADEMNEEKAEESKRVAIVRARASVRELALCNDWEYFFTGTLDSAKQDRFNLPKWVKDLGVWIGNYNKKYQTKLHYLLIPEQHKDGAYHVHGLLSGISPDSLAPNEYGYLEMPYYRRRFGFMSLSPIKNKMRVSSYVTKYITKDQDTTDIGFGKHRYYASRGLQHKERLGAFWANDKDYNWEWENDFVKQTTLDFSGQNIDITEICNIIERRGITQDENHYLQDTFLGES